MFPIEILVAQGLETNVLSAKRPSRSGSPLLLGISKEQLEGK